MAKVAFLTIGLLRAPMDDPQVNGFVNRIDANFAAAEASPGFINRSRFDETVGKHTWKGKSNPPIFQDEEFNGLTPQTLSLWQDLESVFAFAYNGIHAEALSKRKEWFVLPKWPTYVIWWVDDENLPEQLPDWEEAYKRYDKLYQGGASPEAFDFKHPFGPDGQSVKINREVVKRKITQRKSL